MSTAPPIVLKAHSADGEFEVAWNAQQPSRRAPFWNVRCGCPCARCIDEITGVKLLRPDDVPRDVRPLKLELSGNYALKIDWSDGHNTGIYPWELLKRLTTTDVP